MPCYRRHRPGLLPLAVPETPDQCRRWSKAQGRRAVQLVRRGVRSGASGLSWEWRNTVAPELTLLNVQSLLEVQPVWVSVVTTRHT